MNPHRSLYWIARCDRCGAPLSAHAMSVLREEMLCLACLLADAAAIAAQRDSGRVLLFAGDPAVERRGGRGAAVGAPPPALLPVERTALSLVAAP